MEGFRKYYLVPVNKISEEKIDTKKESKTSTDFLHRVSDDDNVKGMLKDLDDSGVYANSNNEIVVNDKTVTGSDYGDILHFLSTTSGDNKKPIGVNELISYLKKIKFPPSGIVNLSIQKELKTQKNKLAWI